jgi:hypothetical protein
MTLRLKSWHKHMGRGHPGLAPEGLGRLAAMIGG